MFAGIKVSRVTGCAGTSVLRPAIVNILVIVGMTGDTPNVAIVVSRVIAVVRMTVIDWRPAIG